MERVLLFCEKTKWLYAEKTFLLKMSDLDWLGLVARLKDERAGTQSINQRMLLKKKRKLE